MAVRGRSSYARGMSPPGGAAELTVRAVARLPWGVMLLSACVTGSLAWRLNPGYGDYRYWWALAAGAMTLALAWRRRYPVPAWAVVTAACVLLIVFLPAQQVPDLQVPLPVFVAPLVALYSVTAATGRVTGRTALLVSAASLGVVLARQYLAGGGPAAPPQTRCVPLPRPHCLVLAGAGPALGDTRAVGLQVVLIVLGLLVAAWALGERARATGEAVTALAQRSAALDAARAGRERAAAADERARVAGELHDITAHHITVVALQAGAARMLAESGRPVDVALLQGIETASREAMTEIRQVLGVIHGTADGPVPQPRSAQLPELADRMTRAGLAVRLDGSPGPLPSGLDLAVYRIVQEGLSNVLRHSAAGSARVSFRRRPGRLDVIVSDDGPARPPGPAPVPGGEGLAGLRARAARLGGQVRAAGRPGGGFDLAAWLPLPDDEAAVP